MAVAAVILAAMLWGSAAAASSQLLSEGKRSEVRNISGEAPNIVDLLQSGLVDYVFSTSAKGRDPRRDSVRLRRKAVELSIPCITAVDTAASLVDCLRSEHSLANIPLVDIATLYRGK